MREDQSLQDRFQADKTNAKFLMEIQAAQSLANKQLQEHKDLKAAIARAGFWG